MDPVIILRWTLAYKIKSKTFFVNSLWIYQLYNYFCPNDISSVYYVQDSLHDEPRVFFDPNTFSSDGTVHLSDITFSDDGTLVSLGLSSKGSDWMTVRFRDTLSGKDLRDTLHNIKFSSIVWSQDNEGIFYAVRIFFLINFSAAKKTYVFSVIQNWVRNPQNRISVSVQKLTNMEIRNFITIVSAQTKKMTCFCWNLTTLSCWCK